MDGRYNTRSPAVKRLMREAQELSEPTDQYFAQPLDDNLFEWHFTIRGPADSDFQNGIYHGRIVLPVDYPMKPPSIIWLTPNGRFETHKKICLSISGHHPESWQPSWSIRTALLAIIGFMPTHPGGAIGSLDYTPEERKVLARKSKDWKCPTCGDITGILLDVSANTQATSNEAKELAAQINLQGEKPKCKGSECPVEQARVAEMGAEAKPSSGPASVESNNVSTGETTSNNSSTNAQGTQASFSPLPSPSTDQQTIPPFPQWSPFAAGAFPMPPMAFPFQYPGLPPVMMPPMQFPYPPSHYPAMPQYPWQPGMPPGGFSPPVTSVNNSSNQEPNNSPGIDFSSNKNGQYSRSPMACPIANNRPQSVATVTTSSAETSNQAQSENSGSETIKNGKGQVFKELLSKVNRVGSEATVEKKPDSEASTAASASATATSSKQEDSGSEVLKMVSKQKRSERVIKKEKNEDGAGTDSEVSTAKCVKKSGVKSVSEMGDANTEDNSDSDVPPIAVDKSPGLEKAACSSTSDLERWKQKYQVTKQVRQRQSATANVSTDVTEEGASTTEPDRTEAGAAGRPKIEAVSGDTGARNRSRQASRLANNANLGNRGADIRENRQGSYDVGFYLMVGLFTTSMLILFNRLITIDWSEL